MAKSFVILACFLTLAGTLLLGCAGLNVISRIDEPRQMARPVVSAEERTPDWAVAEVIWLERGRALYLGACRTCHGTVGNGQGPTARFLDPLPRDFTRGVFKFRSTQSGALPTDADLERTIRVGAPGTDMPEFGPVFSHADRMALVAYVKTFSSQFTDPAFALRLEDIVDIPEKRPEEAPATYESIMLGVKMYEKMDCAKCHGPEGRGDGPSSGELEDDWGRPIKAYDFTRGFSKSGGRDVDLYRSFTTGLAGTPMPAYGHLLTDEERWVLVDYMKTLTPPRTFFFRLFKEKPE